MKNQTVLTRKTKETDITLKLSLNKKDTPLNINSGIGFFDHMLTALCVHSGLWMELSCNGDLNVDCHHTIEDCGIVIGQALCDLLGDKSGIARFGSAYIPMDEALAFASVDISGRPFLVLDADFTFGKIGDMSTQMPEEFFKALAFNAGITLHARILYGKNDHHKAEALFKAVAHALKAALVATKEGEALSTKGILQ